MEREKVFLSNPGSVLSNHDQEDHGDRDVNLNKTIIFMFYNSFSVENEKNRSYLSRKIRKIDFVFFFFVNKNFHKLNYASKFIYLFIYSIK